MEETNVRKKRWKSYLLAGVIFLSGAIVGGVGTACVVRRHFNKFMDGPPFERREFIVNRLQRRLDLTPQQTAQLDALFGQVQDKLGALRNRHHGEVEGIFDENNRKVEEMLDPKQREIFREIVAKLRSRRGWDRRGFGPPPPPPPPHGEDVPD